MRVRFEEGLIVRKQLRVQSPENTRKVDFSVFRPRMISMEQDRSHG